MESGKRYPIALSLALCSMTGKAANCWSHRTWATVKVNVKNCGFQRIHLCVLLDCSCFAHCNASNTEKNGLSSVKLAICTPIQFSNIFWHLFRASDCTWSCALQHRLWEYYQWCSWKSHGLQPPGFHSNAISSVHSMYVPQQSVMVWASVSFSIRWVQ